MARLWREWVLLDVDTRLLSIFGTGMKFGKERRTFPGSDNAKRRKGGAHPTSSKARLYHCS